MVVCQEDFLGWRVEIALRGVVGRGLWSGKAATTSRGVYQKDSGGHSAA
jgi:hypothetical protein